MRSKIRRPTTLMALGFAGVLLLAACCPVVGALDGAPTADNLAPTATQVAAPEQPTPTEAVEKAETTDTTGPAATLEPTATPAPSPTELDDDRPLRLKAATRNCFGFFPFPGAFTITNSYAKCWFS